MNHFTAIEKNGINGLLVPAIIHNGGYYFTNLSVYENARVECWNFEDWEHFKNDVKNGWVVCQIPKCEKIDIHNLGCWEIKEANWQFNAENFITHIENQVKTMNPTWQNIYKYSPKFENGIEIGEDGKGVPYKWVDNQKIAGKSFDFFLKRENRYLLVDVVVFKDGFLQINRLDTPFEVSLQEFEAMIKNGDIVSKLPKYAQVEIYGLGSFKIKKTIFTENATNLLEEIKEDIKEMNGEKTSFDICREMYEIYLNNPTSENKEKLKIAYENVPEHLRMYLGDMDTKDIVIRMIIYSKKEIENWSHYQVAKALNMPLPSIDIPKEKE